MPRQATARAAKNDDLGPVQKTSQDFMTRSDFEDILDRKLVSLKEDLATKDDIKDLKAVIEDQKAKIDVLESKIVLMERYVSQLQRASDDQEQYQRRLCLRINGIEVKNGNGESGEDCLEKVKEIFNELEVDIPDSVVDRAHRIGDVTEKDGKRVRQIIVRFTTWRHRTLVYKARKKSEKYKIRLDLTRKRIKIIGRTNDILRAKKIKGFTFADVNCRLCLKLEDGFHYFEDDDEFMDLIKVWIEEGENDNEDGEEEEVVEE